MKKIILGLVLFFIITIPSKVLSDNKKIFCSSNTTENDVFIVQEEDVLKYFSGDKCKEWQKKYYLSPYQFEVNEISEKEFNAKNIKKVKNPEWWREEGEKKRVAEDKLLQKNELTNCKVNPTTKNEICLGSYKDASGSYKGEYFFKQGDLKQPFITNAMTGKGTFIWPNGEKYEGEFLNSVMNGKGKYFYANGDRYEGEYLKHKINGKGKYFYANGNRYEGEILNGVITGKGTFFFSNGDKYEGEFLNGVITGNGTFFFSNGDKYEGEILNGVINGMGTYFSAFGKSIKGEFRDGKPYATEEVINSEYYQKNADYYKEEEKKDKLRQKRLEEEQRQSRLKYLEDKYRSKCVKNKNNNNEYQKCLNEQEQIAKKNKEQEEFKLAEENKKKQLIADKQKIEREKTEAKIANMKPEERRAYICENTYGFGKGSTKFSDCVYKIMNAEVDLQKLELQKKLAEAQQETARANESAARANASRNSTPTYDPNVAAAMERTNEIERARILLNLGQALRTPVTPQRSAPVPQTNCRVARGGYINCW